MMATFAIVMVIEGDSPVETVDLEAFVVRRPRSGSWPSRSSARWRGCAKIRTCSTT
jgi:hypothetical protein